MTKCRFDCRQEELVQTSSSTLLFGKPKNLVDFIFLFLRQATRQELVQVKIRMLESCKTYERQMNCEIQFYYTNFAKAHQQLERREIDHAKTYQVAEDRK